MRTITPPPFTVYEFDELPTDKAKEAARDWWRDCERSDPAWAHEHAQSLREAIKWVKQSTPQDMDGIEYVEAVAAYAEAIGMLSGNCPFTGYCGDETALDPVRKMIADFKGTGKPCDYVCADWLCGTIRDAMEQAWEEECEADMEDENVDENIRANDYEFTEHGEHFVG